MEGLQPMKNNNRNFKILSSTLRKHLKRRASILNTTPPKNKRQQKSGKKDGFTKKRRFNVNLMPKNENFLNNQTEIIEVEVVSDYTKEEPKKSLAQIASEADTDVDEQDDFSDYVPTEVSVLVFLVF